MLRRRLPFTQQALRIGFKHGPDKTFPPISAPCISVQVENLSVQEAFRESSGVALLTLQNSRCENTDVLEHEQGRPTAGYPH